MGLSYVVCDGVHGSGNAIHVVLHPPGCEIHFLSLAVRSACSVLRAYHVAEQSTHVIVISSWDCDRDAQKVQEVFS